jgi:O-antigen/teichoic acid export membrane protein
MGIVIRQSIYSSIISYAGVVIGYINLLYLYPKFLSTDQIGLFRTIQDAAILFSPFAQFGLSQTIIRFYPQLARDKKSSHSFISLMSLLALVGFALILSYYLRFSNRLYSPTFRTMPQKLFNILIWFFG